MPQNEIKKKLDFVERNILELRKILPRDDYLQRHMALARTIIIDVEEHLAKHYKSQGTTRDRNVKPARRV